MEEERLAGSEVQNCESENAVEAAIDLIDGALEFLPKNLLLSVGGGLRQHAPH
jgi:hypothetical protein